MEFDLLRRPQRAHVSPEIEELKRKPLPIQRRMNVGASDDPHEREADRIADDVVRRLSGSDRPAPDDGVRVGAASRISRRESAGAPDDGFVAPVGVERSIQQARSGGVPLDASTRSKFEGAMGTDLSGVRIHKDANADQLNRQVSAKAFTTGQDVFFSAGTYQPESSAGQHLLAHELAHTVQQGGSVQRTTIRRLALENTDFSTTETVDVFTSGGSGCAAKFTDAQGSVIVKVDQLIGNEVSVADKLAGAVGNKPSGKRKAGKEFGVTAPGSRVASPTEVAAIKLATQNHLISPPRNFVTGLDSPNPVIIADEKTGAAFKTFANAATLTQLDPSSASGKGMMMNTEAVGLKLLLKGPMLRALAQNAPADIVMGMFDRIVGSWNSENFLFDPVAEEFSFVDNTQNRSGGYLTTVTNQGVVTTHEDSFRAWAGEHHVTKLKDRNFTAIADGMLETVANGVSANAFSIVTKSGQRMDMELRAMLEKQKPKLLPQIKKGLDAGFKAVMEQLKAPLRLAAGVQATKRNETVHSLIARHLYLGGDSVDNAWQTAGVHAARVAPPIVLAQAPQRPVNGPVLPPPVQPGGNGAPNNPGAWAGARGQGAGNRLAGGGHRAQAVAQGGQ